MGKYGSNYGGSGGYLPDDCSECDTCGQPMLGSGNCPACYAEIPHIYKRLHLDEQGRDASGRDRSGLAWGYLTLHGFRASFEERLATPEGS